MKFSLTIILVCVNLFSSNSFSADSKLFDSLTEFKKSIQSSSKIEEASDGLNKSFLASEWNLENVLLVIQAYDGALEKVMHDHKNTLKKDRISELHESTDGEIEVDLTFFKEIDRSAQDLRSVSTFYKRLCQLFEERFFEEKTSSSGVSTPLIWALMTSKYTSPVIVDELFLQLSKEKKWDKFEALARSLDLRLLTKAFNTNHDINLDHLQSDLLAIRLLKAVSGKSKDLNEIVNRAFGYLANVRLIPVLLNSGSSLSFEDEHTAVTMAYAAEFVVYLSKENLDLASNIVEYRVSLLEDVRVPVLKDHPNPQLFMTRSPVNVLISERYKEKLFNLRTQIQLKRCENALSEHS